MHHLILGAGPAGVIAAETLRKHSSSDSITLLGEESEPPYSRMALPYLMTGKVNERATYLRKGVGHFQHLHIRLLQARASRLDAGARTVTLAGGEVISFDTLLIATGSTPLRAPIAGIDLLGVHPCWTLADARHIMALAKPGARVLQMGAGFIGCIIMEALAARGVHLSVVEMGERMVPRMMGSTAAGMIKDWCEAKGVKVLTGTKVKEIAKGSDGPARTLKVLLSDGDALEVDLVISATGVKPAINFLENSGIACQQGVLTDRRMQTNVPGIYAAGDCAQAFDKVSGEQIVSAIQPNAAEQARVAALNMLGRTAELKCVTQINVLDTLGLISTSFGNWQGLPGGEQSELTDSAAGRHLSLQFKDDRLVGCNSVGWTDHVGALRGLVEGQVRLGDWKEVLLQDPTQFLPAYLACAQEQHRWSGAQDQRRR